MKHKKLLIIMGSIFILIVSALVAAYIELLPKKPVFEKSETYRLSNPKANKTTQEVYDYLCNSFAEHRMLSGQQESTWMETPDYEMDFLRENTGRLPAIRGLDYMNNDYDGVNQRAIEWWNQGGLVSICWHTGLKSSGYEESKSDSPDFEKLFTPGTDEYKTLMETWDIAARHLLELQEAGVTVIWRPFHEFDGQWFWWGKGGANNFKMLWRMMYNKFTNDYGLNNLIWVLGYSHEMKSGWYVGDEYCDVIGCDIYDDESVNFQNWKKLTKTGAKNKPYAFHECSVLPKSEKFSKYECVWNWFLIWHTEWLTANDKDTLYEVFNSEMVITRDELPDFNK